MTSHFDHSVVMTTCSSKDQAKDLATPLLERKLAACVQIMPIQSLYSWKGVVKNDPEFLLIIKTRTANFEAIRDAIKELHTYEVPELVQIPITAGLPAYLSWIDDVATP